MATLAGRVTSIGAVVACGLRTAPVPISLAPTGGASPGHVRPRGDRLALTLVSSTCCPPRPCSSRTARTRGLRPARTDDLRPATWSSAQPVEGRVQVDLRPRCPATASSSRRAAARRRRRSAALGPRTSMLRQLIELCVRRRLAALVVTAAHRRLRRQRLSDTAGRSLPRRHQRAGERDRAATRARARGNRAAGHRAARARAQRHARHL